MNLKIALLERLGQYMLSDDPEWEAAKHRAVINNQWFTPDHINLAVSSIAANFLRADKLEQWLSAYQLPQTPRLVGITMAGNIPLVGFHDFLCGYCSGHRLHLKLSSKDTILLPHLLQKMTEWDASVAEQVQVTEMLKGCDAYIATGSNNSARYFEQYFAKYPHIIRRNRTSVAVLDGSESREELSLLADDVFMYFGLGCRNVTQLCVPEGYAFEPLLEIFKERYGHFDNHNKYRNNFDYYFAIYLLNRVVYKTNDSVLMVQNEIPFSAVAVVHYRYYTDRAALLEGLVDNADIQCVVGKGLLPFGSAQSPALTDYADGVDVMQFLCGI
jgi:hypothetical protein